MTASSTTRIASGAVPAVIVALCSLWVPAQGQTAAGSQAPELPAAGNFLTRIPLESLRATRDRPLFSPTRRGPPPQTAMRQPLPPPAQVIEETPRLTLLGIIRSSERGRSAVVLDEVDQTSLSLKPGDNRRGWVVQSIDPSSVTLSKNQRSATLKFTPVPSRGAAGPVIDE